MGPGPGLHSPLRGPLHRTLTSNLFQGHTETYLSYTLDARAVAEGLAQLTIPPNTTCALGPRTSSGPLSSLTPTLQWLESMSGHSPLTGGEPRARGWVPNSVCLSRTGRPSAQCLDQPPHSCLRHYLMEFSVPLTNTHPCHPVSASVGGGSWGTWKKKKQKEIPFHLIPQVILQPE